MRRLLPLIALLWFVSCEKDVNKLAPPPKPEPPVSNRTEAQKLRDSVYFYYKKDSYWTDAIKVYNPISTFTDLYSSPEEVLAALMKQTPFHAGYNGPFDRFSRLEDISSGSGRAKADLADGYGMYLTFVRVGTTTQLYVYFVEGGSPAAEQGVKRGDRIIEMNKNTDMSQGNVNFIQDAIDGNNLDMKVLRAGKEISFKMAYTTYSINPVLADTVYSINNKNVGYIAMSSFEEMYDDGGRETQMYKDLQRVFDNFGAKNIADIIVDLRYNVGGYVRTAEYFADKIINSSGDGQVMFKYDVNKNLKYLPNGRLNPEFADVTFQRKNSTNIQKVVFLVSNETASASEIVISALKPYMDVKLIAEFDATFGKPVGFFRQDIMGKVGLWTASFKIINKDGFTDYWDGIPGDLKNVTDNITLDFKDPKEDMIASALNYIKTGALIKVSMAGKASTRNSSSSIQKLQRINQPKERDLIKN